MIEYYKHTSKVEAFQMAKDYDLAQKIESRAAGDKITEHWASPVQDVDGVWYLQKPKKLECSVIAECYPNAVVVSDSDIVFPEPE